MHLNLQNMQQFGIGTRQVIWNSTWFPNFWSKKSKAKKKMYCFLDLIVLYLCLVLFNILYQKTIVTYHTPLIRGKYGFLFPFL